jgi:hypothetical protein
MAAQYTHHEPRSAHAAHVKRSVVPQAAHRMQSPADQPSAGAAARLLSVIRVLCFGRSSTTLRSQARRLVLTRARCSSTLHVASPRKMAVQLTESFSLKQLRYASTPPIYLFGRLRRPSWPAAVYNYSRMRAILFNGETCIMLSDMMFCVDTRGQETMACFLTLESMMRL